MPSTPTPAAKDPLSSGGNSNSPLQSRYQTIVKSLEAREVFDESINNVRARSLAITEALEAQEKRKRKEGNASSTPATKEPAKPSNGTNTAIHAQPTTRKRSPPTQGRRVGHGRDNNRGGGTAASDDKSSKGGPYEGDDASMLALQQTMKTPYFGASRHFFSDLTTTIAEEELRRMKEKDANSQQQQQAQQETRSFVAFSAMTPEPSMGKSKASSSPSPQPTIGRRAQSSLAFIGDDGRRLQQGEGPSTTTTSFYSTGAALLPTTTSNKIPPILEEGRPTLVPQDPAPASAVLQKAMEHVRYPQAEARLRQHLKKRYDHEHRPQNIVQRYFATENINPATAVGLGVLTGATKNGPSPLIHGNTTMGLNATSILSSNTSGNMTMGGSMLMDGRVMPLSPSSSSLAQGRKPGAAPIADGTANPRVVTAQIDFNALHEEELMLKYAHGSPSRTQQQQPQQSAGEEKGSAAPESDKGKAKTIDGREQKEEDDPVEVTNKLHAADAIFSSLDPQSLIRGAENTHKYREVLRSRIDAALAQAESTVLVDTLRSAHHYRPGAKAGGAAVSQLSDDDDEDETPVNKFDELFGGSPNKNKKKTSDKALSQKSRRELKEAMERSSALRAIFSRESDSDDDRGDDTAQQNDEELLRTGALRREARQKAIEENERRMAERRAKFGDLGLGLGEGGDPTTAKKGASSNRPTPQDTVEDLCDLLECCIMSFCEYMHRSTILGGGGGAKHGGNALFAAAGGYEGPPRDISILRSILIHALSSSLPQLKQALHVLEAVQLGTAGAHQMLLDDPLSITAVAVTGKVHHAGLGGAAADNDALSRMSVARKTALSERQQELRFRLFRSWTKAFEVLIALDLRHERNTAAILSTLAAKKAAKTDSTVGSILGGGAHASIVSALGGDSTTAALNSATHPETFTVHNDLHLRRAAAYYCSLHRVNAERREFLMSLWRENKKKFESALLQGRAANPFHHARPDWEEPRPAHDAPNATPAPDDTPAATSLLNTTGGATATSLADQHVAATAYNPYPVDTESLETISNAQQHQHKKNMAEIDELISFFANTKQQLSAEDLSLLDFNSANVVYKQKQLATAFLDRLLPKIMGSVEYRTSVAGVSGALGMNGVNAGQALAKDASAVGNLGLGASTDLKPIDKFRRVLLRYVNLAGHDTATPCEFIDELDATRVDALKHTIKPNTSLNDYDAHHSGAIADQSIGPLGARVTPDGSSSQTPPPRQEEKGKSRQTHQLTLEERMAQNPAATAKLMSVFRNSWGRTTLSPTVQESEAIIRASVLEDTLLISIMDAYFHLLAESLQNKFLGYVREEKKRHADAVAASAAASVSAGLTSSTSNTASNPTASAVLILMEPSKVLAEKRRHQEEGSSPTNKEDEAAEALRHITRLQLLDKYNSMDAAKKRQFEQLAQQRKNAAERLRNRNNNANSSINATAESNNSATGGAATTSSGTTTTQQPPQQQPLSSMLTAITAGSGGSSTSEMSAKRLKQIQKLLQSTDAWFGYEKDKRDAYQAMMVSAGFGDMAGEQKRGGGVGSAGSVAPSSPHHGAQSASRSGSPPQSPSGQYRHVSASSEARRGEAAAGGNGSVSPAVSSTINKSRAEMLRLQKLHELQACWAALSIHYTHKLTLHDRWNSKEKDAKVLDKALTLYKEATIAVLSREAVMEAIILNERKLQRAVTAGAGGGNSAAAATSLSAKAFFTPSAKEANRNAYHASFSSQSPMNSSRGRTGGDKTDENFFETSEAISKLNQFHGASNESRMLFSSSKSPRRQQQQQQQGGDSSQAMDGTITSTYSGAFSSSQPNPVLDSLREIAALPSTGNTRRDCELTRHRLLSELTTCSQRCDVAARRLLNQTGDELLFKNGPYLVKMKEDYNTVRDLMRADGMKKL